MPRLVASTSVPLNGATASDAGAPRAAIAPRARQLRPESLVTYSVSGPGLAGLAAVGLASHARYKLAPLGAMSAGPEGCWRAPLRHGGSTRAAFPATCHVPPVTGPATSVRPSRT